MLRLDRRPSGGHARPGGLHLDAIGSVELNPSRAGVFDCVSAFVDESVVVRAELDKVPQLGRSAASPVPDVVRVQETVVGTTGEATTPIPAAQGSP